eukprot:5386233-Pyramimonas_sp.AAC.1
MAGAPLQSIEAEAERMVGEARPLMDGSGVQRDELYGLAEELSVQLSQMGQQLREIVSKVRRRLPPARR